jgi:hypothetical protein
MNARAMYGAHTYSRAMNKPDSTSVRCSICSWMLLDASSVNAVRSFFGLAPCFSPNENMYLTSHMRRSPTGRYILRFSTGVANGCVGSGAENIPIAPELVILAHRAERGTSSLSTAHQGWAAKPFFNGVRCSSSHASSAKSIPATESTGALSLRLLYRLQGIWSLDHSGDMQELVETASWYHDY